MSVAPLVDLPTSSCVASVSIGLQRVVGTTESPFTFSEQAFKWEGERWLIDFVMPPLMSRKIASDWQAFGIKLEGKYGRFLMGDPLGKEPMGVGTGAPVVSGGGQTGNSLTTSGWTPSVDGILLKGDYIQLGTGISSRLHILTEDANSDSGGNATLVISPALRESPLDNADITINNPRGLFRLNENTFSWAVSPGPIYRISFSASEVINA